MGLRWTLIDTHCWTLQTGEMPTRVKRTYNLVPATVRRVKEMAEDYGVAPSQDAVIELAIDELDRRLRDEREAIVWTDAASDPAFQVEVAELDEAYRGVDRETWPA